MLDASMWVWSWRICAVICLIYAFWRGGPVERSGATIVLVQWIVTILVKPHGRPDDLAFALVDGVTFIVSAVLAVWSHKTWTLFFAACNLIAVASHFAAAVENFGSDRIGWWSYSAAVNLFGGWGVLAVLTFGVWQHRRKVRPEA